MPMQQVPKAHCSLPPLRPGCHAYSCSYVLLASAPHDVPASLYFAMDTQSRLASVLLSTEIVDLFCVDVCATAEDLEKVDYDALR